MPRASVSPDASCRRGTYFFTYGLPVASSRCLAIVRKRPLISVRCSVPPGASAIRATDAAGESSASWLSTAERRGGRRSRPRWLSAAASVRAVRWYGGLAIRAVGSVLGRAPRRPLRVRCAPRPAILTNRATRSRAYCGFALTRSAARLCGGSLPKHSCRKPGASGGETERSVGCSPAPGVAPG